MSHKKSDATINTEVNASKGNLWPQSFEYLLHNRIAEVTLTGECNKSNLRKVDCWALAFYDYCCKEANDSPTELIIDIPGSSMSNDFPYGDPNVEALKRRLSYLNSVNSFSIRFRINGKDQELYSMEELIKRPEEEVIREDYNERTDDDKPGRLEKDFQTYLFGKGLNGTNRTNERLAILGEDFRDLKRKSIPLTREFPTGAYIEKKSRDTRILPTDFIDVVSFNKWWKLSLIELKVNDSKLEVISQSLDYALFFLSYMELLTTELIKILKAGSGNDEYDRIKQSLESKSFVCYIVNNCFHERLDDVAKYYSPKGKVPFELMKVVLGFTRIL